MNNTSLSGKLILILGPSGTGKGTVISHLKDTFPEIIFPISYTTRDMRPNEKDGEVYHFISKTEFQTKIKNNDFLEWAIVHNDNYYGTDKQSIIQSLEQGKTVLREVDIQGVLSLQKLISTQNMTTIFITTDSWENLEKRVKRRANISDQELENRKQSYLQEIQYKDKMDYVLYSEEGQIDECNAKAVNIVQNIINN